VTVHLVKLCAGVGSVDDLEARIAQRLRLVPEGQAALVGHVTRSVPKRAEELIGGGSLYWVIKGQVQCRQRLLGIEAFTDGEGVQRCRLVLDPQTVRTEWRPRRPFQGWRYLEAEDAPPDLPDGAESIPENMRRELAALGLL